MIYQIIYGMFMVGQLESHATVVSLTSTGNGESDERDMSVQMLMG